MVVSDVIRNVFQLLAAKFLEAFLIWSQTKWHPANSGSNSLIQA